MGASLLAMGVNDYACCLNDRGVWTSIASRLAPTGVQWCQGDGLSSLQAAEQGARTKLNARRTCRASWSFPRPPPRVNASKNKASGP
ncbi:hypothetical protein DJ564_20370 [Pseudomonas sp. 31-12]|nr:hypothetical protein DJ564_20370 [Pseudomonas sp. 31-12]